MTEEEIEENMSALKAFLAGDERALRQTRYGYLRHRYNYSFYWSEEEGCWVAVVPSLPGCSADGATIAEMENHLDDIIDEWIDTCRELGRDVPPEDNPKHSRGQRIGKLIFCE